MKRSRLKADPAKVRDWQQRSRVPLKQDPDKGLKRSGLASRPREPQQRAAVPADPMRAALQVPFRAKRPARTQRCFRCGGPAKHWHHWVPQEHLRVMMRGLARAMCWEPEAVRRRLRSWLRDEANLSAVCISCHGNGGTAGAEFRPDEVPPAAVAWATELDDMLEAAGRPREAVVRLSTEYQRS